MRAPCTSYSSAAPLPLGAAPPSLEPPESLCSASFHGWPPGGGTYACWATRARSSSARCTSGIASKLCWRSVRLLLRRTGGGAGLLSCECASAENLSLASSLLTMRDSRACFTDARRVSSLMGVI